MIGIISRTEGEGSGAEIILCHLLNNWSIDYPLLVITARNSSVARTAKSKGIKVIELSFVPERLFPNVKIIEKCLKELKGLKLIHAWNSKSFELGWYISKRLGIKLTCTMHDHPRSSYLSSRKLWLLRRIANGSSGMIAVSNVLTKECRAHKYRAVITTIHNGLPPATYGRTGKDKQQITVGFLGMSSEVKGFPIIAGWIRSTAKNKAIQWRLYGQASAKNEEIAKKLTQEGFTNFKICGRQSSDSIFKEIDVLVHASTVFDCYPTVLLEAARAGILAIASTRGGAEEIVDHEYSGFLFNPDRPESGLEYLSRLCSDDELYSNCSSNARKKFDQYFTISRMADKYREFWLSATKRLN
jgi:glycosyltransferase involved in cell wall biosynthesis